MRKIEHENSKKNSEKLRKKHYKKSLKNNFLVKKFFISNIMGIPCVNAPTEVVFDDISNVETDTFLKELKDVLNKNPQKIYLSFKNTKLLNAMALLVIYSIIDRARISNCNDFDVIFIRSKNTKQVNKTIINSGNFKLADTREKKGLLINSYSKSALPVIMGSNARAPELSDLITSSILINYFPEDKSPEKEHEIADAIQETIENVGRHAYPEVNEHDKKYWWLCCDRIGKNLFLVIYDCGLGIPDSLLSSEHNKVFLDRINALYPNEYVSCVEGNASDNKIKKIVSTVKVNILRRKLSDGQLIRAAMHNNFSSTAKCNHGQGSKSIKSLIKENDKDSFLLMLSDHGFYRYRKDIVDDHKNVKILSMKVPGTLIQWSI